ncbi:MAG: tRNA threonylcarbamoyladenosine dehydratase, partial [Clostridia bacterium]
AKLELISRAKASDVPVISCMGTGNKIYTDFVVCDIAETSVCPLCKVMRKELKARGVEKLKVVFSKETPLTPICAVAENGRHLPGSISYAPAVAGLTLAGEVIRDLLK